ncbi:MAG: hypothetical protein FWH26_10050 [Oscillospiraceae bacterium]|nr:hypothetical protein [Oscillospiraceae bacterium]
MKKILALALALLLALGLFACGGTDEGGGTPAGNNSKDKSDTPVNLKMPEGWDENPYGWWIEGKWDSSVLPDCVPNEIAGVEVDQTTYKTKAQDTLSGSYDVGAMSFPDKGYEAWGLSFYCTDEQLAAFAAEMTGKGFLGGQTGDGSYPEYEWAGNGYYAFMRVNNYAMHEGYGNLAMFSITPADAHPRPKAFQGTKLPDIGMVLWDYSDGVGYGWDAQGEVENFWNVITDKGALPAEGWGFWLEYFGTTEEQARAYVQDMTRQGWTIDYENTEYGYTCQLSKDGIVAGVRDGHEGRYKLGIGFASMGEALWY